MGKTKAVDPARVREKLDILEPRLAALLKQADEERDMKKKVKLAKKADQIRDLLFRLAHLFVIVGNPCFCLYNFRHVLVLLTNTKPG